jgi:hypothetical protein
MAKTAKLVTVLFVPGHGVPEKDIRDPEWADVAKAIHALDGKSTDQVFLIIKEETHLLGIGGGEAGIYVCDAQLPEGQYTLVDPKKSDTETVTVSNGDPLDYVRSHTVDLDTIIQAARWFFDHGELAPSFKWVRY